VQDTIRDRFGASTLYTDGLQVQTTLQSRVQQIAEQAVAGAQGLRALGYADNTAVVVLDAATSQILAMVGSKNFDDVGQSMPTSATNRGSLSDSEGLYRTTMLIERSPRAHAHLIGIREDRERGK
jgi:cell division protein FtsI/penicillin-binding protein 2